jgi:hypothetical protein
MLSQMTDTMIHNTLPQMISTTNDAMITDEHHHAPRDMSMLHEKLQQMVQVEDECLASQCSTPANTRALS